MQSNSKFHAYLDAYIYLSEKGDSNMLRTTGPSKGKKTPLGIGKATKPKLSPLAPPFKPDLEMRKDDLGYEDFPMCCGYSVIGEFGGFMDCIAEAIENACDEYVEDNPDAPCPRTAPTLDDVVIALRSVVSPSHIPQLCTTSSETPRLIVQALPLAGFTILHHHHNRNSGNRVTLWVKERTS